MKVCSRFLQIKSVESTERYRWNTKELQSKSGIFKQKFFDKDFPYRDFSYRDFFSCRYFPTDIFLRRFRNRDFPKVIVPTGLFPTRIIGFLYEFCNRDFPTGIFPPEIFLQEYFHKDCPYRDFFHGFFSQGFLQGFFNTQGLALRGFFPQ